MAFKTDSKKIEILAFVPIGRRPDRKDGEHRRIVARQTHLQAQAHFVFNGEQVVIDLEARLKREAVKSSDIRKKGEPEGRFGYQKLAGPADMLAGYYDGRFALEFKDFRDRVGVPLAELTYSRGFLFLTEFLGFHFY